MARASELTDWLLSNTERLELNARPISWIQDWFKDHFDFEVTISIGGRQYQGRGIADSEELALVKAGAEALERCVAKSHGLRTNGIAAHTDLAAAQTNAKLELLERDAFFCHYLTNTPFRPLATARATVGTLPFDEIAKRAEATSGVQLKALSLNAAQGMHGCAVIALGLAAIRPFGLVIGLGASANSLSDAISKATFECLANVFAFIEGSEWSPLSTAQFLKLQSPEIPDHLRLGLDLEYAERFVRELLRGTVDHGSPEMAAKKAIVLEQLHPPVTLSDCPLKFVRATCGSLQNAFWGHTRVTDLNMNRLREFTANLTLSERDIQMEAHPLG